MTHLWTFYAMGLASALLAFPLGYRAFSDRQDRGIGGARILALVLVALAHRLAVHAGLSPWSAATACVLLIPATVAWLYWLVTRRRSLACWLRHSWRGLAASEGLFLSVFVGTCWLVAHDPALFGTERLMDFALFQSVLGAADFPPADPWFAGEELNYYWFGHHLAALPSALGAIPAETAYNIALAYFFACLVQLAYSLFLPVAGGLRRTLVAAILVGFAGNLHPLSQLVSGGPGFSILAASRVIPHSITEHPLLSLLVGDLHAHYLLLPVLLLSVMWLRPAHGLDGIHGRHLPIVVLNLAFLATALGNPWNLAAMILLFGVVKAYRVTPLPWWTLLPALLLLPALWPVQGQGIPPGWVGADDASPLAPFLLVWGIPLLLVLGLLEPRPVTGRTPRSRHLLWMLPVGVLFLHAPAAGISLGLAMLITLFHRRGEAQWAALAATGLILLAIPELVYLRDGYPPPYERMNTVFKFSYAAWPLLMLAAARGLVLVLDEVDGTRSRLRRGVSLLALAASLLYPAQAISWRLTQTRETPQLDGIAALITRHREDIELVRWLEPRLSPGDRCLEAPGVSYQWSGRISALSGCPTVLGWEGHERVWRRDPEQLARRRRDVHRLYQSADPDEREALLRRYGIDWVIVGETERSLYRDDRLALWDDMLRPAYATGNAKVYRVGAP